ncbi:hypothetical protein E2C01_014021 [Portunus trituberculatus]|uniref:Uncharacterized protein n=1 Tax=Portunus trituberculatus TaxID=210409 RepID=A0A5B7DI25_PORTR|nr:hypothetical protein [Portunus trituberculatus]
MARGKAAPPYEQQVWTPELKQKAKQALSLLRLTLTEGEIKNYVREEQLAPPGGAALLADHNGIDTCFDLTLRSSSPTDILLY